MSLKKTIFLALALASGSLGAATRYTLVGETGFLAVLKHDLQFGKNGTYFSLDRDGGQDTLFATQRVSLERAQGRHTLTLLYQPLDLISEVTLKSDLVTDGAVFAAGSPIKVRYSFPFYRVSWAYNLLDSERDELSLGFSMQVRNANIEYWAFDGSQIYRSANIGPVPLIKLKGRWALGETSYLGLEADGIYAPVSVLNGSDEEIIGALLDASLRAGQTVKENLDVFINFRYLGGGAVGTNKGEPAPKDGYVRNWLHFGVVSVGASIRL